MTLSIEKSCNSGQEFKNKNNKLKVIRKKNNKLKVILLTIKLCV